MRVYIDNNVWDLLFDLNIDLSYEFPSPEYEILITREAEFELACMPVARSHLLDYIRSSINEAAIRTDNLFGFNDDGLPLEEQRVGGFGVGRWASSREIEFLQSHANSDLRKKKTKLFKNEADVSLASRSFEAIVLTLDKKNGPLKAASEQNGMVIFLTGFRDSGTSLREFTENALVDRGVVLTRSS